MDITKPASYNVIPFTSRNNHVSPSDLDDIMEDLKDMGYLSDEGIKFKSSFWRMFIKGK